MSDIVKYKVDLHRITSDPDTNGNVWPVDIDYVDKFSSLIGVSLFEGGELVGVGHKEGVVYAEVDVDSSVEGKGELEGKFIGVAIVASKGKDSVVSIEEGSKFFYTESLEENYAQPTLKGFRVEDSTNE